MKSKLKIYTSFVSPRTLDMYVKANLLPIFILRHIGNSELIGKYSRTAIHFVELSPSSRLYQERRDGLISGEEFRKGYTIEISDVNLEEEIRKLEILASLCNASGVVLLGYGTDYHKCHRSTLAGLLNESGLLEEAVKEIIL